MIDQTRLDRQIHFVLEIDNLKGVLRRTWLTNGTRVENSAEHSWHLAVMVILLAEYAADEELNLFRAVQMALVHDLVEIDAGDTFVYDEAAAADKAQREQAAAERIFGMLPPEQAGRTARHLGGVRGPADAGGPFRCRAGSAATDPAQLPHRWQSLECARHYGGPSPRSQSAHGRRRPATLGVHPRTCGRCGRQRLSRRITAESLSSARGRCTVRAAWISAGTDGYVRRRVGHRTTELARASLVHATTVSDC